jgi:F-type H+-transporting ATPase subunit a
MEHEVVHAATEAGEQGAHSAVQLPELPNFIHLLHNVFAGNTLIDFLYNYQNQFFALLVVAFAGVLFHFACRHRSLVPGRLQALAEMFIDSVYGIICGILGEKEARRFFPFLGSLFIFILFMNWFGLIPLMKAPTSTIQTTAGLAITVFFFVQWTALTRLGLIKYIYHLMGEPKDTIGWCLVPLFLPLHIMEEFIKPLSLACRLFGNVFGEDILLGVALLLGITAVGLLDYLTHVPFSEYIGIPLHVPFMFLGMLTSTIQALVFTLLSTVYISLVLPHEEHGDH